MQSTNKRNGSGIRYDILGQLVADKRSRDGLSLRAVTAVTGISASTLSRLENGKTVETEQVISLARWLKVKVERFTGNVKEPIPRVVKSMLLADPKLGRDEAAALGAMFSALYRQMAKGKHTS